MPFVCTFDLITCYYCSSLLHDNFEQSKEAVIYDQFEQILMTYYSIKMLLPPWFLFSFFMLARKYSLLQLQCHFCLQGASAIVRYEYHSAHTLPKEARDHRLIKMCHGIWTKLRHERQVHRLSTKCNSSRTV